MKKDQILQKVKSNGLDEREQTVVLSSLGFSTVITTILCFIFVLINGLKGQDYSPFIIIAFSSLAATYFYQYTHLQKRNITLISALANLFVALLFFIVYVLGI